MEKPNPTQRIDNDQMIKIEMEDVQKSIDLLSKNTSAKIDALPKTDPVYKAFETVKLAVGIMYDTPNYHNIVDMIPPANRPKDIVAGTVGAFLYGCSQDCGNGLNKYCSPLCIQNVLPDKSKDPITCCKYQVWVLEDDGPTRYDLFNDGNPDQAYLYVKSSFPGLNETEINKLKAAGVKSVQILNTVNSCHHKIGDFVPVDNLSNKIVTPTQTRQVAILGSPNTGSSWGWFWGLLLALIIIAVVGFLIYWFIKHKKQPHA